MKKILSFFMLLCMPLLFAACDFSQYKEEIIDETDKNGNIIISLDHKNIKEFGIIDEETVTIPEIIEFNEKKYVVTEINNYAFKGFINMETLNLPSTITTINGYAFYNCENLKNITIPKSVTSIGNYAFYGCTSLETLNIPETVTKLGYNIITKCSSISNLTIDENNKNYTVKDNIIYSKDETELICVPYTTTNFEIPDTTTKIFPYAFSNSNIQEIIFNSNIEIGEGAFLGCGQLTKVILPENISKIEKYTFYACTNLTEIHLPETITHIGNDAFFLCKLLRIDIPISVIEVGKTAFKDVQNINYQGQLPDCPWGAKNLNKPEEEIK